MAGGGAAAGSSLEALRLSRLRDLVDIAKGLNLAISTDSIFARISEAVFRSLSFIDRLALLVDIEGKGELQLLHHAARGAGAQDGHVEARWVSRSVCGQAFGEKAAILTADAQQDERFEGVMSLAAHNIHAAMAAPLWNEDQVLGVLYADARMAANRSEQRQEEDLGFFTSLANLAATATHRWLMDQRLKSEEMVRRRLERYHSPAVVQKLAAASAEGRLVPEEREITVLFADIVGFTSLSETLSPADVARMLNVFFEEMHTPVFSNGGTLDKYIGDCVMAFFGAPEKQEDHAARAVRAATEMLARLEELNSENVFVRPLKLRIAINSGAAVVGDIGSVNRLDYTALGATVNLASRIEPLCAPGECLIGEATHALVAGEGAWEDTGLHRFKGIDREVRVWRWGGHAN
jgi:adenylate cyclase